jgi:hypothetical protein
MRTEFRQATTPDKAWPVEVADRRHGRCQALSCLKGGKILAGESLKPGNFCPALLERKNAGTDRLGNVRVRIFFNDTRQHRQPHFHASSPDEDIVISIADLATLAGSLRQPSYGHVIGWARASMAKLKATWNQCNPQMPIP